ncbi:MAG TPA: response regulator [Candidatus Paceibacterota bacterium]|nr:response regulator [Candidatus Paceibacterota bacterium]
MSDAPTKRILIAEDEHAMGHALELKLIHEGFDAKLASNGEMALEMMKSEKFDILLLDIIMPKMNGFQVLEEIKKQNLPITIIMLSNLSQGEDEKKARDLGAKDFFIKSNTPLADIVTRVKAALT